MAKVNTKRDKNYILFVTAPGLKTHTLRNLPTSLPLSELKAKLELTTGYPCNTYNIYFGSKSFQHDRDAVFDIVSQSGSVIRMVLKDELKDLHTSIQEDQLEDVIRECTIVNTQDEVDDNQDTEKSSEAVVKFNLGKMYFAAFRFAFEGNHAGLKELIMKLPVLLSSKTLFGRTLAHIAAVSDHPLVLQQVLLQSVKYKLHTPLPQDKFCRTPSDVATEYNAFLCERMIREFRHYKRDGSLVELISENNESLIGLKWEKSDNANSSAGSILSKKKTRAKSAIVRSNRTSSVMSQLSSDNDLQTSTKLKKDISCDNLSSGYQTEENIPSAVNINTEKNNQINNLGQPMEKKTKRVHFKTRIKSAPPTISRKSNENHHHSIIKEDIRLTHTKCYRRKPFLAYREVPFEELKQQSVEYVPLDSKNIIGMDARTRERCVMSMLSQNDHGTTPFSSLNNSIEDINDESQFESESDVGKSPASRQSDADYAWQLGRGNFIQKDDPRKNYMETKQAISKRFTNPKTATSKRAQSAGYYEAQYHKRMAQEKYYEDIPRPRPKTAGPRYRAWKPWLLEVYEEEEKAKEREKENEDKRKKNVAAFKSWLKQKQIEEDEASSSDDSSDDAYYDREGETFEAWLKRKKPMLDKMDKATLDKKRAVSKKEPLVNRGVSVFELVSTDGTPMKIDHSHSYMYAYQKWQRRKMKYEHWKKAKGLPVEDASTFNRKQLKEQKTKLYLDGFTYNEWLGQKYREELLKKGKKNVQFKA